MKRLCVLVVVAGCSDATESRPAPPVAAPAAPAPPAEPSPAAQAKIAQAQAAVAQTTATIKEAQEAAAKAREGAEAQRVRQEAIEAARQAGVLGSAAFQQGGSFASLTGTGDIPSGFDDDDIAGGLLGDEIDENNGGFGLSGSDPGGGGTGAGTIGTGRYGTIGRSSGAGTGYGGGGIHGRTADVPQTRLGQPTCTGGDLDNAIVRRYIKRNLSKISYCYEKQLLAEPTLDGTVTARFTIGGDGAVTGASADGVHGDVAWCIAEVIERIEFPAPKDGAAVACRYPIGFRPTGG